MSVAFDSLAYMKCLESAGVPRKIAEAHTTATRELIMDELVTKAYLKDVIERLSLQLTIRLGGMLFVAVGALALLIRLPT